MYASLAGKDLNMPAWAKTGDLGPEAAEVCRACSSDTWRCKAFMGRRACTDMFFNTGRRGRGGGAGGGAGRCLRRRGRGRSRGGGRDQGRTTYSATASLPHTPYHLATENRIHHKSTIYFQVVSVLRRCRVLRCVSPVSTGWALVQHETANETRPVRCDGYNGGKLSRVNCHT